MILIVANLLIAQSLMAQSNKPEFSVVGAVIKSSIVGESESWKDPVGAQAGVIVNILNNFSKSMSVRAELNISMQGARWEDDWGEGLIKGRVNLLYANLPVVLRYQHESGFFGEIGLQPGLLLSAKDKYQGTTDDYSEWVNKFDFGIPFGIGYELKNNLGLGLRVIPSITNVNAGEDTSKDHNFVVALRATYTFKKK